MLLLIYFSNEFCSYELSIYQKKLSWFFLYEAAQLYYGSNKKCFLRPNQHIRMISEPCETDPCDMIHVRLKTGVMMLKIQFYHHSNTFQFKNNCFNVFYIVIIISQYDCFTVFIY